jgi:hypothetical protein
VVVLVLQRSLVFSEETLRRFAALPLPILPRPRYQLREPAFIEIAD